MPPGAWLDAVDYSIDFPGQPLVAVGVRHESPFRTALASEKVHEHSLFFGDERHGWGSNSAHDALKAIVESEDALLSSGPQAADEAWRELAGSAFEKAKNQAITIREYGRSSYGSGTQEWFTRAHLPSMLGMSPAAAAIYLAATGKSDKPIPVSAARALLKPDYDFPTRLAELDKLSAPDLVLLKAVYLDEQRRLVLISPDEMEKYEQASRMRSFGQRDPLRFNGEVLSEGWRPKSQPLFRGYPAEELDDKIKACLDWPMDHDATRLVRLERKSPKDLPTPSLPVVELDSIVPDIKALLSDIRTKPADYFDRDSRAARWERERPGISQVALRIVEGLLVEYCPWPHPFRMRSEKEMRLRVQDSNAAVVDHFHRLLDAPGPLRPNDLTAYFFSLITKQRAEFTAWPEDCFGVWGFKIKTGDHNWINGCIWHEPGVTDDSTDPVEWEGSESLIENTRYRGRYRHRVHLRTGSLRCFIERDDT